MAAAQCSPGSRDGAGMYKSSHGGKVRKCEQLLAKTNTWEEGDDWQTKRLIWRYSRHTESHPTWYSCESLRSGPTRCQPNQLLTRNLSPSTLQQVLLNKVLEESIWQNLPHTINKTPVHVLNKIKTNSIQRITNATKELCIANYTEKCIIKNCYICNKK